MTARTSRIVALLALFALLVPLVSACGGGGNKNVVQPTPKPGAQPTAKPGAQATTAPAKPATAGDPTERVTEALGLLMGTGGDPGALPSFHIQINDSGPSLDMRSKEVKTNKTRIKADVQGVNAHLWVEGEDGKTTEGYVIGNDDYVVEGGQVKEGGLSGVGLTWAVWQLDPVVILSLAGLGARAAGTEAIDGRTADVFEVDMAKADPAVLATVKAFVGRGITVAKGKAWVDQQTGALLKTVLDYEQDLYDITSSDKNAPPVGHGAGHIDIAVSQVGKVSVSLPK